MDIVGHLPIEIAQQIFQHLSATDLSSCCRVSKTWRNFANSDILWRDICLKKGIICELEYYNEGWWELDPMVDWAHAYMCYVKRRFNNWRRGHRIVTTINSCYDTIACCTRDTLVFTNASRVIFVYDISRRKPFCLQTIHPECTDKEIQSLDMTANDHLIVRQGDSFAIYVKKDKEFKLKGYLLRHEDSYVFTKNYYETNEGPGYARHVIIDGAISISVGKTLFMCTLLGSGVEIHSIGILDQSFLLHDRFRTYVLTGDKTVTGFDVSINYEDFYLEETTVLAMKSNKNLVVGLISSANSQYEFHVWSLKYNRMRAYTTHRPFGFEVHPRLNVFTSVSLDKFNRRVLLTVYDLEYNLTYEVDLNDLAIAQVKLSFIGRDLLYCATRSDWDMYDTTYILDLTSMRILYESDIGQMSIVSVDSKHAVYLHGEAIEIHTYHN